MINFIPHTILTLIQSLFSKKKQYPDTELSLQPRTATRSERALTLHLEDGREIPYSIRVSPRAQSVRLRLTAREGLTVVTPVGLSPDRLENLLRGKRHWIARHWQRFEKPHASRPVAEPSPHTRPEVIELSAIGEFWRVEYRQTAARTMSVRCPHPGKLIVSGPVADVALCRAVLRRWLLRHAHQALLPWLNQLSAKTGLPYAGLGIRLQRSRWGSCSSRKSISLNAKLLFLPPELARYVMLHELCHTCELNHSQRFWTLVGLWEPNAKGIHTAIHAAGKFIPEWVARGAADQAGF